MAGCVYVFQSDVPGLWSQTSRLTPSDTSSSTNMGASVGVYNATVAAGATGYNDNEGSTFPWLPATAMGGDRHAVVMVVDKRVSCVWLFVGAIYVYYSSSESAPPTSMPTALRKKHSNDDDDDALTGPHKSIWITLLCAGAVAVVGLTIAVLWYVWGAYITEGVNADGHLKTSSDINTPLYS